MKLTFGREIMKAKRDAMQEKLPSVKEEHGKSWWRFWGRVIYLLKSLKSLADTGLFYALRKRLESLSIAIFKKALTSINSIARSKRNSSKAESI